MGWKRINFPLFLRMGLLIIFMMTAAVPTLPGKPVEASAPAAPALAVTNTVKLEVYDIETGAVIPEFKFLISIDNTGDPFDVSPDCQASIVDPTTGLKVRNPNYPGNCNWPSLREVVAWAPIYASGDQTDAFAITGRALTPGNKYLVSVTADGYKLSGQHFAVPLEEDPATPGLAVVKVYLLPTPLETASMVIKVFDDSRMTNGQFDDPGEVGVAGFRASINDIFGEVTTDVFGNPLCTQYAVDPTTGEYIPDPDTVYQIEVLGTGCVSDDEGMIEIYNLVPLRYDVLVIPPDGTDWVQTTTLEGSQGWDTWLQERGSGLDNEFVLAAEPFPWTVFGFVRPTTTPLPPISNGSTVQGTVMGAQTAPASQEGMPWQGTLWGGFRNAFLHRPVEYPMLSLNDLQNNNQAIWVGQGDANGSFSIPNVPAGNYVLTFWDEKQHYILDLIQFTVHEGESLTDLKILTLGGWFTEFYGTVFYDDNENGKQDPGEPGIPNYLVVLKDRDNTEIDRMSITALTDPNGRYVFEKAYPMTSWMVLEAYNDLYRTTGITFQAWNQPEETTVLGAGVDVGVLPQLGQSGRLDWGVKFYGPDENGGIVGTVFYDTVRSEDNAQFAGAEPWQPGIPDLTVNLYATVHNPDGSFAKDSDGSYAKGALIATTTTETYNRAKNCQARDGDGTPIDIPALPPATGDYDCLEGPITGIQFDSEFATLDGNYGFGDIPAGSYLVEVEIPNDAFGNPMFKVTREEDRNVFSGDEFTPQIVPPECAGPLHIVDIAGYGIDGYGPMTLPGDITVPASTPTVNPSLAENGGSRYEGQPMPMCNVKLVNLSNSRSIAPIFTLFTDVPIPGRWKGYIIDDLNIATNPDEIFYGEAAGLQLPIGLYDYKGRLVETVHSDLNGVYEALLPSTNNVNVPSPSGMAANVYYMYGNDPGLPEDPNPDYNPQYRSIGANFEIYPGTILPSDLAPTLHGVGIWAPEQKAMQMARCSLNEPGMAAADITPELYRVSRPYARRNGDAAHRTIEILGYGFGTVPGKLLFNDIEMAVTTWTDRSIAFTIPQAFPFGEYQLEIVSNNGRQTVNGIGFHVLGGAYNPPVYEVGPGPFSPEAARTFNSEDPKYTGSGLGPIQDAIDTATRSLTRALIVIYPDRYPNAISDLEAAAIFGYVENLVMYYPVKLQGVGPGGMYPDGQPPVLGTVLDGRGALGDTTYRGWWRTHNEDMWNFRNWDRALPGDNELPLVFEGAVVTVLARGSDYTSAYLTSNGRYRPSIDGMLIQGGEQANAIPGKLYTPGKIIGYIPEVMRVDADIMQGGGVFVNGYAHYLQIANNVIQSNGGDFGSAIRLGTAHVLDDPDTIQIDERSNNNRNINILNNIIRANGSVNLAGAVGIFNGSPRYEVAYNDFCGNFSVEGGAAVGHYGYSDNSRIHHNRMYYNHAYEDGGAILISGEVPLSASDLSEGAGRVDIYNNLIQSNLSQDDGGGIRFTMAGLDRSTVYNNIITNNIAAHEGGGISLFDAPSVAIYNNTIIKNVTTATGRYSSGAAAPAGISSVRNSSPLQAALDPGSPIFSNPIVFNNILWDNRAGSYQLGLVTGIGLPDDPSAINQWGMGTADNSGSFTPKYNLLQEAYPMADGTNLIGLDPLVLESYDLSLVVIPWRGSTNFHGANVVSVEIPAALLGDYHLAANSPAVGEATSSVRLFGRTYQAPRFDYDDAIRPYPHGGTMDIGADEYAPEFIPAALIDLPALDDLVHSLFMPAINH